MDTRADDKTKLFVLAHYDFYCCCCCSLKVQYTTIHCSAAAATAAARESILLNFQNNPIVGGAERRE
jgi:hypothetical protein